GLLLLKPHLNTLIEIFQAGRFDDIPVTLSVNVNNLILVAAFSIFTVMLSALIPAVKMGKIGPVESIRGNVSGRHRRYRSQFRLIGKRGSGICRLLAVNGTHRLPHLTRGIVRSIAVFGMLTAVTLYGAQSVIRVVNTKLRTNNYLFNLTGYDYVLISDSYHDDLYQSTVERITKDSAVTQTKEIADYSFGVDLSGSLLSDEYMRAYEEIIRAYVPSDEAYVKELLQNERDYSHWVMMFGMEDEDFKKLAAAGDADESITNDPSRPAVLLYRKVELSTDNIIISGYEADYHFHEVQNAFRCAVGDELPLIVESSEGNKNVSLAVAGFLDEADLAPYFSVHSEKPFAVVNRSAAALIEQAAKTVEEQTVNNGYKYYLFGIKDGEGASLLKELSRKEEQVDGVYHIVSYDAINGEKGFYGAIVSIIRILAYCFTALISMVCLLNLWHSVKGRAVERRREIAMLRSMGMTNRQLRRMLAMENLRMTGTGLLIAAALSSVFMLLLNRAIIAWIGRIT
ncbi:MAG: ABC transporter permease, partial [Ruminococcus sp.]|nr:ABC transporter permease [Ruminococcus sp.]